MTTTTVSPTIAAEQIETPSKDSLFSKFMNWCKAQQENRLLWLGIVLTAHGCIITPLTVMAILLAGTNLVLFILAIVSMGWPW